MAVTEGSIMTTDNTKPGEEGKSPDAHLDKTPGWILQQLNNVSTEVRECSTSVKHIETSVNKMEKTLEKSLSKLDKTLTKSLEKIESKTDRHFKHIIGIWVVAAFIAGGAAVLFYLLDQRSDHIIQLLMNDKQPVTENLNQLRKN